MYYKSLKFYLQVYGVAQALVSIGYEHSTCKQIVWETQTATLQAFDVDISDVGGWSLDVHHHYNFNEGTFILTTFQAHNVLFNFFHFFWLFIKKYVN